MSFNTQNKGMLTSKRDTSLYIGSNNVASDIKVDPDKFTLWKK